MSATQKLLDAFRATTYRVYAPNADLNLRVGQANPSLDALLDRTAHTRWTYLTAFNPGGQMRDEPENIVAQKKLLDVLIKGSWIFYPGETTADDGQWPPEPSFLVLGMARSDGVALAQKFAQAAILYGQKGSVAQLIEVSEKA